MNLKNFALAVAIAVLTICVTVYGINTFYSAPKYDDFCGQYQTAEFIDTPARCEETGGYWYSDGLKSTDGNVTGYCDRSYYCSREYTSAQDSWNRNVFFIGLPLGIIIILLGAFLFNLEFVGAGLMWGGVATIIYSTWGFFIQSADWIKFLISLIALGIIIYFAYWYTKRVEKKKSFVKKILKRKR